LISQRPVEGYGWGATWEIGAPARIFVERAAKFDVPSAHNGYLDIWLQAGIVGLVLLLLLLGVVLLGGLRAVLSLWRPGATWGPLLVTGLLVYNIGEASMISKLSIWLVATVAVSQSAPGSGRRHRCRRAVGASRRSSADLRTELP